jgi:hypothetical protein
MVDEWSQQWIHNESAKLKCHASANQAGPHQSPRQSEFQVQIDVKV